MPSSHYSGLWKNIPRCLTQIQMGLAGHLPYNNFSAGANSDAGIGNRPGRHPDWTFSQNLKNYKSGWLFVIAD